MAELIPDGFPDTTPLNAISKVSQVILSGVTRASGGSVVDAQRLNLLGAGLTNIGANQGVGKSYPVVQCFIILNTY